MLPAWLVPDGPSYIVALGCDDPKYLQDASRACAALEIGTFEVKDASFGSRAWKVPKPMLDALLEVDERNRHVRRFFDVVSVTAGPLKGLRAVGLGSNTLKRERACKAALVVAAMKGPLPPGVFRPQGNRTVTALLAKIQASHLDPQAQATPASDDEEAPAEAPAEALAEAPAEAPRARVDSQAQQGRSQPAWPTLAVKTVWVDELDYSQSNCRQTFQDGRALTQLVQELCQGKHDPLESDFLCLEVVKKRGRLFSNDNRRLWCLKKYQEIIGQKVRVKIRLEVLTRAAGRFAERFDTTVGNKTIRLRGQAFG